jgi:hypothetical protein
VQKLISRWPLVGQHSLNADQKGRRTMSYHLLANLLESRYGVGPLAAPPIAIVWATEYLITEVGKREAERQLKSLNRRRTKMGKIPAYRF